MKICCFHGTASKLYYPKTRPQGFLGSTFSGHLLLEVASWLPKKGHFSFFPKISFWICFGIFWIFLDCFWIVFGLQEGCPGAFYPFLMELFQKNALGPGTHFLWRPSRKMPWGLAPISCGGLPEKRPGAWHPIRSRSQAGIPKWNLWIGCLQHMHELLYVAFSWKHVAFMEQHPNYTIPKLGPKVFWDLLLVGIYF